MGVVGSVQWCAALPGTAANLAQVGQAIISIAGQIDTLLLDIPLAPPQWFKDTCGTMPFGIGDLLLGLYAVGSAFWDAIVDTLRASVKVAVGLAKSSGCATPDVLVGCIVTRGMATSLKNVGGGISALVQGGFSVQIQWTQAEAILDYIIKWLCPFMLPTPGEARDLFKKRLIPRGLYECYVRCGGEDLSVFEPAFLEAQGKPGLSDRQQFLYRLRDANVGPGFLYSEATYRKDLQWEGFSDADIELLDAIKYRTFQLREIMRLMDTGALPAGALEGALRAEGWNEADIVILAKMENTIYTRRHQAEIQGWTPARIAKLYSSTIWAADDVNLAMGELGYSDADSSRLMQMAEYELRASQLQSYNTKAISRMELFVEKSYKEGLTTADVAMQLLTSVGAGKAAVTLMIQAWEGEANLGVIESAKACIKKGWESGYVTSAHATEALIVAGYRPEIAIATTNQWQACRDDDAKVLSAGQIISGMVDGRIDPVDALARMVGMGYSVSAAQFLIQGELNKLQSASLAANQKAIKAQEMAQKAQEKANAAEIAREERQSAAAARAAAAAAKAAQHAADVAAAKSARDAMALARAAKSAAATAAAELRKLTPPALLESLLKIGQISLDAFTARMECMGYTQDAIDLIVAKVSNEANANIVQSGGPADDDVPSCPPQPS